MKIAVLSDLHLSDGLDESHLNVFREALKICRENNADVIACAGDMVKAGACAAASFLIESLKKLHQVRQSPDGLHNHTPITGWYESLISLASFISEWKNGTFKDALLFVECRGGWESSYSLFKNELLV